MKSSFANNTRKQKKRSYRIYFVIISDLKHLSARPAGFNASKPLKKLITLCTTLCITHTASQLFLEREKWSTWKTKRKWQSKCWQDKADDVMFYRESIGSGGVSEVNCQTCSYILQSFNIQASFKTQFLLKKLLIDLFLKLFIYLFFNLSCWFGLFL